jgi:hypothetical protein
VKYWLSALPQPPISLCQTVPQQLPRDETHAGAKITIAVTSLDLCGRI